jgi:hypothetical protein
LVSDFWDSSSKNIIFVRKYTPHEHQTLFYASVFQVIKS